MSEARGPPAALGYRRGVGVMLLNRQGLVFAARRIDTAEEAWQMPQGGIDPGEDPRTAALRELREEIGTDRVELLAESGGWLRYDLPEGLAGKAWGGGYRGQEQKWFAMRFLGGDGDIDLKTAHPEFCDWRWVEPEGLTRLIVPFKRALYAAVLEEFRPLLAPHSAAPLS